MSNPDYYYPSTRDKNLARGLRADGHKRKPRLRRIPLKAKTRAFHRGAVLKPGFSTYYTLGAAVQRKLPVNKSWKEISVIMGVTHQNAFTEAVLALGKVIYLMKVAAGENPGDLGVRD